MRKYNVQYARLAWEDISGVFRDILTVSQSEQSAEKWVNKIIARAETLNYMPRRYTRFRWSNNESIRSTNVGKYKVIYKIYDSSRIVKILRVIYGRIDFGHVKLRVA